MEPLSKHIEKFLSLKNSKNFILVRHGQSMANIAGSINGWTDVRMSYKGEKNHIKNSISCLLIGREQASNLCPHLYKYINNFDGIFSSDLERAMETAKIALGFPPNNIVKTDRRIREMFYGQEEGNHFDSLPEEEKNKFHKKL